MKLKLLRSAIIDYASASAAEYHNGILYLVGDDINYIACLDNEWKITDKIHLFDYEGLRIPKPDKPDLECAAIIDDVLYLAGSGSRSPQRDVAFIVQTSDHSVKKINTTAFYSLFRDKGLIREMNLEGFTSCGDKLLFFNRGNTTVPNQLIITDRKLLKKQLPDRFKVMPVETVSIGNIPLGISGASYDAVNDVLLLTASAENTDNSYDDGAIHGSALAVVHDAYKKFDQPVLKMDEILILEEETFKSQKIESLCILSQEGKQYHAVLVADNDDGSSALFEVEITL